MLLSLLLVLPSCSLFVPADEACSELASGALERVWTGPLFEDGMNREAFTTSFTTTFCACVDEARGPESAARFVARDQEGASRCTMQAVEQGMQRAMGAPDDLGERTEVCGTSVLKTNVSLVCMEAVDDLAVLPDRVPNLTSLSLLEVNSGDLAILGKLSALERVYLSGDGVAELGFLADLPALRALSLVDVVASDLTPLLARADSLTELTLSNVPTSDLTPVGQLVGLQQLEVWRMNHVKDLSALASLTHLKALKLDLETIGSIDFLTTMTSLSELLIGSVQAPDWSPLAGLEQLTSLNLVGSNLASLAPLQGMRSLNTLELHRTSITDLVGVEALGSLVHLDVSETEVVDFGPVASCLALEEVYAMKTGLQDLAFAGSLPALKKLVVPDTAIRSVEPLRGAAQLEWLDLSRTAIEDVTALHDLSALSFVGLEGTNVSDADASKLFTILSARHPNTSVRKANGDTLGLL